MDTIFSAPHFQKLANELLDNLQEKERMEHDFSIEIADDYSYVKQNIAKAIIELIKVDIPYTIKGNDLSIALKGVEVTVPLSQIKPLINTTEYELYFSEKNELKELHEPPSNNISELVILLNSIQREKEILSAENQLLKDKCHAAESVNIDKYEREIKEWKIKCIDLEKRNSSLINEISILNKKIDTLSQEEIKNNAEGAITQEEELTALRAENERLEHLAYHDIKTGILNVNAFNRDFNAVDVQSTVFLMVSICKMKLINEVYGRNNGDAAITRVAHDLFTLFSYGKVYRVMGDKFNIIIPSTVSYNDIYSAVANLKAKLEKEKIETVFGIASGLVYPEKGEMIKAAEAMLLEMKNGNRVASDTNWKTEDPPKAIEETTTTEISAEDLMAQYLDEVE